MRTLFWVLLIVFGAGCIVGLGFLIAYLVGGDDDVNPTVMTTQGPVRGVWSGDGEYSLFIGIPFATVDPENPFGEALPGPVFDNVFDANDDSAICPQREEFNNTIVGTLDCLHLHVYVPSTASSSNPLPVMVWIYGGGFTIGWAGRYVHGPDYLVRHDVIMVAINYRLGAYGFMCLDDPRVPGNTGLKDQRAGLRWVNDNIAAFGGDPESITIFGESAGAMSAELQVISPGSQGLFHRAILQSGSVFIDSLISTGNPTAPIALAAQLGLSTNDFEEAFQFIKSASTDDIVAAQESVWGFGICTERTFEGQEQFLVTPPSQLIANGQYERVPMIIGFNSDELLVSHVLGADNNPNYFDQIQTVFRDRLISSFNFESPEKFESAAQYVKEFYIGNKPFDRNIVFNLSDFDSDFIFNYPAERSIVAHLANSNNPMYQYVFAYSGEVNFVKRRLNITEGGAVHADDLGFLFKQDYMPDENNPEDQLAIDRMTTLWTNFAKYGDPTPETSELLPVRWPAATRDSRGFLWMDSDLTVHDKAFQQRTAIWDLFYTAFGRYQRSAQN